MNIALYIPLGYLLPYCFVWFRERMTSRVVLTGFLLSMLTENVQLITGRGLYDLDDILTNTLGALIGVLLFRQFAFIVTHPYWRKERKRYLAWRKRAHLSALYPAARHFSAGRATLMADDEASVWQFYVHKLGFRPLRRLTADKEGETALLLELGGFQLELLCRKDQPVPPGQQITLAVPRLDRVLRALKKHQIPCINTEPDPYTGSRAVAFEGPDGVTVRVIEHNEMR